MNQQLLITKVKLMNKDTLQLTIQLEILCETIAILDNTIQTAIGSLTNAIVQINKFEDSAELMIENDTLYGELDD